MVAENTVGWWRLRDKLLRWVATVWSVMPVVRIWSLLALWSSQSRL